MAFISSWKDGAIEGRKRTKGHTKVRTKKRTKVHTQVYTQVHTQGHTQGHTQVREKYRRWYMPKYAAWFVDLAIQCCQKADECDGNFKQLRERIVLLRSARIVSKQMS